MNTLRIYVHKSMTAHPDNFSRLVLAGEQFPDLDIWVKNNNIFVAPKSKGFSCPKQSDKSYELIYEDNPYL